MHLRPLFSNLLTYLIKIMEEHAAINPGVIIGLGILFSLALAILLGRKENVTLKRELKELKYEFMHESHEFEHEIVEEVKDEANYLLPHRKPVSVEIPIPVEYAVLDSAGKLEEQNE